MPAMIMYDAVKNISDLVLAGAQILQALVASAAILAGAWWFIVRRANVRKANVSHDVTFAEIGKNVYVGVRVSITNSGNRRIVSADQSAETDEPLHDVVIIEELSPFLAQHAAVSQNDSPEYNLLTLGVRKFPRRIIIEPKEEQAVLFEFVIPKTTKTIKVYSHIDNAYNEGIGWDTTTIHKIET